MQRYRDKKIRVCDKNLISSKIQTERLLKYHGLKCELILKCGFKSSLFQKYFDKYLMFILRNLQL